MDNRKNNNNVNNAPNSSDSNTNNNGDNSGIVKTKGGHDISPSVPNRASTNVFSLIPTRLKEHRKHLQKFEDKIKCTACSFIFYNDIGNVLNHITSKEHMEKSMMNPLRFKYQCEICPLEIHSERNWWGHLASKSHKSLFDNIGANRRPRLQEYECYSCYCVIYGDLMSVMRHENLNGYKADKKNSNRAVLKKEIEDMFKNSHFTNQLASRLKQKSESAMKDNKLVQKCLTAIEDIVKSAFPDCKGYIFGSRMTGLGNAESDLDIFLDIGNMYNGEMKQQQQEQHRIFNVLKKIICDHPKDFIQLHPIPTARTPIIQVTYVNELKINCDLSFTHGLSVENTKFVRFCFDLQPIVLPAMLVLKEWALINYLKEEISSYAFLIMFIFYLQINGYLLSVHELREITNPNPPKIHHWKIIDYNKPVEELRKHVKTYKGTIFQLIKDFFKMYQHFAFDSELVCPLLGRTIFINKFENNGKGLPREMNEYKEIVELDSDCEFSRTSAMCIQDPFDLGHNLTKKVPLNFRSKFEKLCELSYNFMTKTS